MERPIGEVFQYKKHKLEVVVQEEEFICEGCYFENKNCDKSKRRELIGICHSLSREDNTSIIFKEIK